MTVMKENAFYQSALRAQILTLCRIETVTIENCREISIQIFNKDKNYLSQKTIQRFFGLIRDTPDPSPFVLDSLAMFTGNDSWDQFKEQFIEQKVSGTTIRSRY